MKKQLILTLVLTLCIGGAALAADNYTTMDQTGKKSMMMMQDKGHQHSVKMVQELLNKSYGNSETFERYGVMYHKMGMLHIAIIDQRQREEVMSNLKAMNNPELMAKIIIEPAKYAKVDYDKFMNDAITVFTGKEGPGKVITATPDVENERINLVVTSAKAETVRALEYKFGKAVNVVIGTK